MTKGFKQMLAEANAMVGSIDAENGKALVGNPDVLFVDVRDITELRQTGKIPGAVHAPRGHLEFHADPESPRFIPVMDRRKRLVIVCASGGRSALAGRTLKEMGYADVWNLVGGMAAWQQAGGATEAVA